MPVGRDRVRRALIRRAKAAPPWVKAPGARAVRRFRGTYQGPLVSVVLPISDDDTTRIGPCLDWLREQLHTNLDVLVVPFGRHERVLEIARSHTEDWRIRLRRPEASLAAARNAGAEAARGELLMFVSGGDELLPRGIRRLVASHQATGSPLVVGEMKEPDVAGFMAHSPYDAAHRTEARRATLERSPVAITDLGIGNRLFTRDFWRSGFRFTDEVPSGADVAIASYRKADTFDLLREPVYVPTGRKDGVGVGTMPDVLSGLDAWLEQHERLWKFVEPCSAPVRAWWLWGVLDAAVQPLIADVERADDAQWQTLRDHVGQLLDVADDSLWSMLSAESRVKLWLLQHDRRRELEEFAAARLFTSGHRPTEVRDGSVWAQLPFHDDPDVGVPPELYEMAEAETRLLATVRQIRWNDPEHLELTVHAAIDHVHFAEPPELTCALVHRDSGDRIDLPVTQFRDPLANLRGRRHQDFSLGAFTTVVDLAALVEASGPGEVADRLWTFEASVTVGELTRSGGFTSIDDRGTAGLLGSPHLAPRLVAGARVGLTARATTPGVLVSADRRPMLRTVQVVGREVTGTLDTRGLIVTEVRCESGTQAVAAVVAPDADGARFTVRLRDTGSRTPWQLVVLSTDGTRHSVCWPADGPQWLGVGGGAVVASRSATGATEFHATSGFVVDAIDVDDVALTATGRWLGTPPPGPVFELAGDLATVTGRSVDHDGAVEVRFDLAPDTWGLGPTPVVPGAYWLKVRADGFACQALIGESLGERMAGFSVDRYATRVVARFLDCGIELQPPLANDERGPYAQTQLQEWCRTGDIELDERSVYLQSYVGASATDSQLAIHEELRRTRPDLTVHWGVAGPSSWVPEGAVPVVMNTREWYRALAASKYLCFNIDPERWFTPRPGQRVLQTFHGYPAKSMGLRMWRAKHHTPKRIALELARTSGNWDLILTPAPEMDEHYRREYAYDGPILSQGYPRDDVLVSGAADAIRIDTRRRLGIGEEQKVILYAPTWRDDLATNWRAAEMVQHLDLEAASRALGPEYVLLRRGHRFNSGSRREAPGAVAQILDVTDYPEINHLILASDAAVLDYSSLRFDFALTQRPMIFLVPDLADYVGGVRGFLYDYADSAPGPLVNDAVEAVELLADLEALRRDVADDIERFNRKYNYLQDGAAASRVVETFFK
ncbi:bifunctional glycosyltransferase/CDP-glycerol:glycerophosphate glycerophosphotransferase [Nocardioides limicola]|uniref:bifunctional glycosyltransferase/CDP-glycerol:glycerophosphate glycerophosphotransferase n=1 Tax=Nocardioides limicola TaxID=2803368 RepID=UPI00193BD27A|nr:CDP-glycerol glycerophosphotransferase family protein [Nocardioides sp. DJM-14]